MHPVSDNLNEFGLSGAHYKSPRLIILGLIKRVQEEKYLEEKRSSLAVNHSSDVCPIQFEFARHIGQFAINVYYASW